MSKYTHIFNLSIDPQSKHRDYNFTNRIDEKICKKIRNNNIIYIYPSTRFVYEKNKKNYFYQLNKIRTEKTIKKLIKHNYLILRIGNLLAFDLSNKSLFITKMLHTLKNKNEINFDIKKKTFKDFITFEYFAKCLDILIEKRIVGTYNFSSGKKMNIYSIGKSLIKGYGKGKISFSKSLKDDSFVLDNSKLKKIVKFKLYKKDILDYCYMVGQKLKKYNKS